MAFDYAGSRQANGYHPQFYRWRNMIGRCYYLSVPDYEYYGARGITVCDRWHVFANFVEDAPGLPGIGADLDRIDNDLGYSPTNCRWASRRTNLRNTRRAKTITWRGETHHYLVWAERLGIHPETLRARVFRHYWPLDRAMMEGTTCQA